MSLTRFYYDIPFMDEPFFSGFQYDDQAIKSLDAELNEIEKGENSFGNSFQRTTNSVRTKDGVRTHDVKSYMTSDGREIIKETRRLGDQAYHVTKVKGTGGKERIVSGDLEGKQLEDFTAKWNSFDSASHTNRPTDAAIQDKQKMSA
jgi:hypothetical protein